MKNRRLLYILLPAVLLVWGIIIYRFLQAIDSPVEDGLERSVVKSKSPLHEALIDTFSLNGRYSDPFLSYTIGKPQEKAYSFPSSPVFRSGSIDDKPLNTAIVVLPTPINWPVIEYLGYLENKKKKTKIAILKIGGKDMLLKEKENAASVLVEKVYRDSVRVSFQKEEKTIIKLQ